MTESKMTESKMTARHVAESGTASNQIHGVGLFSGRGARVRLLAPPVGRQGIFIERPDVGVLPVLISPVLVLQESMENAQKSAHIHAQWMHTLDGRPILMKPRNTTLVLPLANSGSHAGVAVAATIEHVLSALAGLSIWNATIVLEGDEVPIADGSALPFVELARASGLGDETSVLGLAKADPLVLTREIKVSDASGATIIARPLSRGFTSRLSYTYCLDYGSTSPVAAANATWLGEATEFVKAIAPARTFSLVHEAHAARAAGLFTHLSPADMLVIGDDGVPIDNAWRVGNELAAHKLLDLIGDLALIGKPLCAEVIATRSGHALAHELCRRIVAEQ